MDLDFKIKMNISNPRKINICDFQFNLSENATRSPGKIMSPKPMML